METHGKDGITKSCLDAIVRLLSFGERIEKAVLLSCIDSSKEHGTHGFLLVDCFEDTFCIRTGFTSGYSGEGPTGLSSALLLLLKHGVEIDEVLVSNAIISKLNSGRLNQDQIENILSTKPVRPTQYYRYIQHRHDGKTDYIKRLYPLKIPFRLIDDRIMDLALRFDQDPDLSLLQGYRRLEDLLRKRTEVKEATGSKLFAKVFSGNNSILHWENSDPSESAGKANLFTAIYMGYRNSRAHKEIYSSPESTLMEFLMLNELFILESTSIPREAVAPSARPNKQNQADA
jgi:hypothetical protein